MKMVWWFDDEKDKDSDIDDGGYYDSDGDVNVNDGAFFIGVVIVARFNLL